MYLLSLPRVSPQTQSKDSNSKFSKREKSLTNRKEREREKELYNVAVSDCIAFTDPSADSKGCTCAMHS